MYINFDKIFENLRDEAQKKIQKEKENKEESKEKAKFPEEIAKECMKITEDIHGGNEDAREVKSSDDNTKKQTEKLINEEFKNTKIINELVNFQNSKKKNNKEDEMTNYIVDSINEISKLNKGDIKKTGYEKYDTKAIAKHILTEEDHKILTDKYDKNDGKTVQFFIDTSGSNYEAYKGIQIAIEKLSKQGYTCYIADCGNGFASKETEDVDNYNTERKLRQFRGAKVSKIKIPCVETAKKMCEDVDFSIILGDFDGLSSFSRLASICKKDKIPYFFDTETRYTWEDATYHNWVEEEYSTYPLEKEVYIGFFLKREDYDRDDLSEEERLKGEYDLWKL